MKGSNSSINACRRNVGLGQMCMFSVEKIELISILRHSQSQFGTDIVVDIVEHDLANGSLVQCRPRLL